MWPRPRWVLLLAAATCLLGLARADRYFGTLYRGWDAQFYYAAARSIAFDRDLDVTNDLLLTPAPAPFDPDRDGTFRNAPRHPDGRIWSKYPIGMSLTEAPLMAGGSMVRRIAEAAGFRSSAPPGYSAIELWSVALGLTLAFAAGFAALYRLLAEEYGPTAALLGAVGAWGGTSLLYYSAVFPFMAHPVSFALLVAVMRLAKGLASGERLNARLTLLGLCLGAIFLVRPQQVCIAVFLIPLATRIVRMRPIANWIPGLVAGAALGTAAVALQLAFNVSQVGTMTLSGYAAGGEGFHWLSPNLSVVLLSQARGLLVYSPIVVLAVAAHIRFGKSIPGYAWAAAGNAAAQVYIIAAWSSPEQGDAFGARMWSDNAASVAVGLAAMFGRGSTAFKWIVGVAVAASVAWTAVLMMRYIAGG